MSDEKKTTATVKPPKRGSGPGSGMGAGAAPAEKPKNFLKTIGRLIGGIFGAKKALALIMILFLILGSTGAALGPKALGEATNVLFNGLISKQVTNTLDCSLPNGVTIDQIKPQISDDDGYLDVNKLESLMEQSKQQAAAAGAKNSQNMKVDVNTEDPSGFSVNGTVDGDSSYSSGSDTSSSTPTTNADGTIKVTPFEGDTSGAGATFNEDGSTPYTDTKTTVASTPKEGCEGISQSEVAGDASSDSDSRNSNDDSTDGTANDTADVGSLKDMLGSMQITIGGGVKWDDFIRALSIVLIIYIMSLICRWIGGWCSVRIIATGSAKLRAEVECKIWRVPLKRFDKMSRGDIMSRMTNDLDNVQQILNQTGGDLVYLTLMVIFVLIMMFTTSWLLSLIALVSLPLSMLIVAMIMKLAAPAFKKQWSKTGELNATVEEAITGHIIVKTFGQKDRFVADFEKQNMELYKAGFKAQFISGTIMPVMTFVTNINYVLVAIVGGIQILNGNISLGNVQALIQYSRQYSQPVTQISQSMNLLQSCAASAERIYELLDLDEELDESENNPEFNNDIAQNFEVKSGEIVFNNVDFSYDPSHELIKGLDLKAKAGETVAIVGETGAGKTTLVNLIMRFYDVDNGQITFDGVDSHKISRNALRKNISMVLQDSWLFKGTIRENLLYGVPEGKTISDEDFYAACKATYVDHFIQALPNGYDTVLDDDGSELSNGERQLLTIARAFLADANVLILDEATSSVDTRTEVLVQKAMNKLRSGRTSFVIAHRLSTIRDADLIVVMEKGHIVEQGNHDQLISSGGHYAKLYQSQFEREEEDELQAV